MKGRTLIYQRPKKCNPMCCWRVVTTRSPIVSKAFSHIRKKVDRPMGTLPGFFDASYHVGLTTVSRNSSTNLDFNHMKTHSNENHCVGPKVWVASTLPGNPGTLSTSSYHIKSITHTNSLKAEYVSH